VKRREALPSHWRTHPVHIASEGGTTLHKPLDLRPPQANEHWAPLAMKGQQVHVSQVTVAPKANRPPQSHTLADLSTQF
jgi:hypothetical protein